MTDVRDGETNWKCRHCGQVLGMVRGKLLLLSLAVAIDRTVSLQCLNCRRFQTWYEIEPRTLTDLKSVG